jgi:hypothetical protein
MTMINSGGMQRVKQTEKNWDLEEIPEFTIT